MEVVQLVASVALKLYEVADGASSNKEKCKYVSDQVKAVIADIKKRKDIYARNDEHRQHLMNLKVT